MGVADGGAGSFKALLDLGGIGGGEGVLPVVHVHDGVDGEADLLGGGLHGGGGGLIGGGGALDLLEAAVFGELEALEDREVLGQHAVLDRHADGQAGGGAGGGGGDDGEGGSGLQESSASRHGGSDRRTFGVDVPIGFGDGCQGVRI